MGRTKGAKRKAKFFGDLSYLPKEYYCNCYHNFSSKKDLERHKAICSMSAQGLLHADVVKIIDDEKLADKNIDDILRDPKVANKITAHLNINQQDEHKIKAHFLLTDGKNEKGYAEDLKIIERDAVECEIDLPIISSLKQAKKLRSVIKVLEKHVDLYEKKHDSSAVATKVIHKFLTSGAPPLPPPAPSSSSVVASSIIDSLTSALGVKRTRNE